MAERKDVTMNSAPFCASIWGNLTLQGSCFFKLVLMFFSFCERNVLPLLWVKATEIGHAGRQCEGGEVTLLSGVVCDFTLGQV